MQNIQNFSENTNPVSQSQLSSLFHASDSAVKQEHDCNLA